MRVHLEGMGVVGTGCAWALHDAGVDFTWSDNGQALNAWMASTGAVYPDPEVRGDWGWHRWWDWANNPPWGVKNFVEAGEYWYCTQAPPHGYKCRSEREVGPLKKHPQPSFHVDVQGLVEYTRHHFRDRRRNLAPGQSEMVVAHGFNQRLTRYVWGWARQVNLDYRALGVLLLRPALYLRRGRVVMAYAYPRPGMGWYAGSSLIVQKEARHRDYADDWARWERNWEELTEGLIPFETVGPVAEGWRPSTGPVSGEPESPLWSRREGPGSALQVMPMWHSGVRWLPLVAGELLHHLGVKSKMTMEPRPTGGTATILEV